MARVMASFAILGVAESHFMPNQTSTARTGAPPRRQNARFALKNVRISPPHVVIDGKLNQYSLHLGSGSVSRMPGGSVRIIPVHAQHRGRLFLPFVDNDPKTAEVISK